MKKKVRVIETEVYSRVVGYYRPVQNFNTGKKQEFEDRTMTRLPERREDDNDNHDLLDSGLHGDSIRSDDTP